MIHYGSDPRRNSTKHRKIEKQDGRRPNWRKGLSKKKSQGCFQTCCNILSYFREAMIKSSRISLKRWELNNSESMKSTSSEMITPSYTLSDLKHTLQFKITPSSFQVSQKPKPSRTYSPISSNNWVPSNTNSSKNSSNKPEPPPPNKSQTSLNPT